jgi:hypothetical protein
MQQQGSYCLMGVTDLEYSMANWGSKDVGHRNYRGCDLGPNEGSIISDRVIVKKRAAGLSKRRGADEARTTLPCDSPGLLMHTPLITSRVWAQCNRRWKPRLENL